MLLPDREAEHFWKKRLARMKSHFEIKEDCLNMAEKKNGVEIDGFSFASPIEAEVAAKEAEGVKFIKEKADMNNPDMVLNIYNKMIQQKLFETAVGYSYMKELQEYLVSIPFINKDEIRPIPIAHPTLEESLRKRSRRSEEKPKENVQKEQQVVNVNYKTRYRLTRALSIIFAVCIVAMFVITATTNNTTILNYEQEIINRYEAWETELTQREEAVRAKEIELGIEAE